MLNQPSTPFGASAAHATGLGIELKAFVTSMLRAWQRRVDYLRLSDTVMAQVRLDRRGLPTDDPGVEAATAAAMQWLCEAQDRSTSADGGVSRDFSLVKGWATSYPETTGYIIPTFIDYGTHSRDASLHERARRMLDWLVRIQMPSGAFQGGKIDSTPVVPVVFNTGQILIGLARAVQAFGQYRESMIRAADWLVEVQDADGCWRRYQTPFATAGEKTYDTHTAWGLFEAARVEPDRGYAEAGLANVRWALTHQRENGWMDKCCLSDFAQPLTHTLGYSLRGMLEAYRFSRAPDLLAAARRTADGLRSALKQDGFLPGQLASDWSPAASWACLTGSVQIAYCWLALYQETGDVRYRDAGVAANRYVRRTLKSHGPATMRGAVKGSFPVDGEYCRFEYPNWAAKFLVDALLLEGEVSQQSERSVARA
jgi:hypothetical protein